MLPIEKNKDIVQKIAKLSKRIDTIDNIKLTLVDFLVKYYNSYSSFSKDIKTEMEKFQDLVFKKSFYATGKCREIKGFISVYKHFCVYIESMAKVNVVDLKRIDFDMAKQEDSLCRKSEEFIKSIWDYSKEEENSNKIFNEYKSNCQKLDQMMNKFKSYEDPVNFYSLHAATDFSKKLDKKFHQCENDETTLKNKFLSLDQNRSMLTESLKDIKEDYVLLLHNHIVNIENVAECLIDMSKDEMYENMKTAKVFDGVEGDMFNEQIQRFTDKYGKGESQEDDLLNDLKQLFTQENTNIQISSDYKLFLDRCESFLKNRYQYVDETIQIQKKTRCEIYNQYENCRKIDKNYEQIQREVFRSDGIENFKKMIGKYFGQDILSIAELCFFIVENPRRRFEKIGKIFQKYLDKLSKIIELKEEFTQTFKKRMEMVLSEHELVRNQINKNNGITAINANRFNVNVEKTFENFKKIVHEFSRSEKQSDEAFNDELRKLTTEIKRQASHSLLGYILGKQRKEKQKIEFLHRMNIDSIIIGIVKSDTRYQILFNDPLKPSLLTSFNTLINLKKFEQTKSILKKKQYQERAFSGERVVGCCGLESKKMNKYKPIAEFRGYLLEGNKKEGDKYSQRRGEIQILEKGLMFEQKSRVPFSTKMFLMIPGKQIISARVNDKQERNTIQILTKMGTISFISDDIQEIQNNLEKVIGMQLNSKDGDSRKQPLSDSSSFFKQNNTSTQYKISIDSGYGNTKDTAIKASKSPPATLVLEQLSKKWLQNNFLSEKFTEIEMNKRTVFRHDYKFKDSVTSFILKQKKIKNTIQVATKQLKLKYEWKISFPEMPMLKSFRHEETVTISLDTPNLVKITIMQKHREESHLFVRKIYFTEIDKMNKQISDFIAKFCERDAQVKIDQQASEADNSTNLDFEEIGMNNTKQQIMYKTQSQRASRIGYQDKSFAK